MSFMAVTPFPRGLRHKRDSKSFESRFTDPEHDAEATADRPEPTTASLKDKTVVIFGLQPAPHSAGSLEQGD